jgi:hypothetical protein
MNKRNKKRSETVPFPYNNNIAIYFNWMHGKDEIVPGDKILFKNTRGKFTFVKVVENREKGVVWIDCLEDNTRMFKSFYTDKLKCKVKPRKQRKKNV